MRNEVNHKIRRAKIEDFNSTINNKIKESKNFHLALKNHNVVSSKKNEKVPCIFSPDQLNNTFITNNNAPVNLEKITQTINKINRRAKVGGRFHFREVTEIDIIDVVKTLKSNSCGVDEISAFFVKLSIQQSAAAIAEIVNVSFRYNKFPERYKKAIVIAIPNIPSPLTPSDYRPISLLSIFSKILEKIAAKQMTQYLILHSLLDKHQSGYKPQHSTGTALLEITDFIFQALDQSNIVIKTLLDYSKAFDCANHNIILAKLKSIGFTNSALNWINSYLTGRSQSVKTDAGRSHWKNLQNGVPQGSILGPLLFTILLLDIKHSIRHCNFHLYADDTQIFISGKIEDILALIEKINTDLKGIQVFSDANNLTLNVKKCKFIIIGSASKLKILKGMHLPPICINNKTLKRETEVENLGVLFDERMTWEKHINKTVAKAFGKLKCAYRAKNFLNKKSKATIVEYYVLSQLNYCSILFQNLTQKLQDKIQKLQNSCTRFIFGLKKYDHISEHFKQLKVLNMDNRRSLQALTLMHKIVSKKAPSYLCNKLVYRRGFHQHNTRGRSKIHVPRFNTNYGKNRFFRKIAIKYNNILDMDGFNKTLSSASFKKKVKEKLLLAQS